MVIEWAHYQRNKPAQSKHRTKVFISEPDPTVRQRFGRLFGVLELNSLQPQHLRFLHALIEELERAYYPHTAPHGPAQPIAQHLEATLRTINNRFLKLAESHNVPLEAGDFSFLIGALKERDLVFTHYGNTHAFLLHRDEGRAPKLIDIITASEKEGKQDDRFFSSLLEGQLGQHDGLLVATEALVDYLSLPQLQDILAASPARESVEQLERLLEDAPEHLTFPLLVVSLAPDTMRERSSSASVAKLLNTERTTEQILSPSVGHDIRQFVKAGVLRVRSLVSRKPKPKEETLTLPKAVPVASTQEYAKRLQTIGALLLRGARVLGKLLLQLLVTTIVLFFRGCRWIVIMLMRMRGVRNDHSTQSAAQWSLNDWKSWLYHLPGKSRFALIGGIAVLVIFGGSLVVIGVQRSNARAETAFQAMVKSIEEKKAQVEMSLIYSDDARAKQSLQELNSLLTTLPTNRAARRTKKQELEASVASLRARINKNSILDAPERVIDLSAFAPRDRTLDLKAFVLQDNNLYVYGDDPLLFKVNLENQQAISFEVPKTNVGKLTTAIAATRGTILLVDDQNRLIELNPEQRTLKPLDIIFGAEGAVIRAGAFYNDRLYLIDAKNQQIYRHQKVPTGYGKGTPWLKESVNLTDAQDLIIDASLWVLFADGSISNLAQGKRKSFTIETIDPALTRATRISTTFESRFITLLDPTERRVVVLRKSDGKLAMQYSSPAFDNLKDLFVDESKKVMYVMSGTTVYKIPLQHL